MLAVGRLHSSNMEYAKEIIALLSSVIAILIGGGGILYYGVNKRLKNIQADREASAEWKKLYDEKIDENKILSERLNELYQYRRKQSDEINKLNIQLSTKEIDIVKKDVEVARKDAELAQKDVEITKLMYDRCFITGCKKRVPKRNEIETESI